MKKFFTEEKSMLAASGFMVLFVFFTSMSSSLKSIFLVLSLITILATPYYRHHIGTAFNTLWGRAALILFLYIVCASFWSDAPWSSRFSAVEKYSKLLYLPLLAVGFLSAKTRQWAFNAYMASMLISCVICFLKQQNLLVFNTPDPGEAFYNHIATGFLVALAVYFAAVLFFQTNHKGYRIFYAIMIIVGSYQVFFINTGRTGYIIYGILMSLFLLQKLTFKKAIVGIILLCTSMGIAYLFSPVMQTRIHDLMSDIKFLQQHEENTSLGFRVQFHQYARSLFARQPLVGLGTGSFKYRFSQEQPIPMWNVKLNDPHSQYWLLLAEQGIIGLVLFLFFIGSLFISAFQLQKTRPILLGMLISFVFGCFSDTIFCYSPVGTLLIIISAISFAGCLERNRKLSLGKYKAPVEANIPLN